MAQRKVSRRKFLVGGAVATAGAVASLAGESALAASPPPTIDPASLGSPIEELRTVAVQSARNSAALPFESQIAEPTNCYWELLPAARKLDPEATDGLVQGVAAYYAAKGPADEAARVESVASIVRRCLAVTWTASSAGVATLRSAGRDLTEIRGRIQQMDAIAGGEPR